MTWRAHLNTRAQTDAGARILLRFAAEHPGATRGKIVEQAANGSIDRERRRVLLDALDHELALYDTAPTGGEADVPITGWHSMGNGGRMRTTYR